MGDLFFPIGIGLILLAVAVSAMGLRNEGFPSSRGALLGTIAVFALVVAATMTTAVINAKDEQQARDEENAAADVAAGEEQKAQQAQQAADVGAPQTANAQSKLDLSAPANGDLAFDPPSLEASAGKVEIDFTNPAPIERRQHRAGRQAARRQRPRLRRRLDEYQRRPAARRLHLLLLRPGPSRGRDGGHAHRRLTAISSPAVVWAASSPRRCHRMRSPTSCLRGTCACASACRAWSCPS